MPIKNIYVYILERVLKEIGSLWQTNKITCSQNIGCFHITNPVTPMDTQIVSYTEKLGDKIIAITQ